MSALIAPIEPWVPETASDREWVLLAADRPQVAATMGRYVQQLSTFLAPRSVEIADITLRQLARWMAAETDVTTMAGITRTHMEDYKVWLAAQPGAGGGNLAKNTQRHRLRDDPDLLRAPHRVGLERCSGRRNPLFHGDIAPRTDPLPKFLNDQDAAKLMQAARAHRLPRYRLVIEMLARTGMRAGELCDLAADAVTLIGDAYWLRIPVGKLRNDRFIPLHPELVVLLAAWTATNSEYIRAQKRLMADHHSPIDRRTVHRIVATTAKKAGHRQRPPAPAPPHTGHPSHQPGHAPRSHRRPARSPIHGHDPHLCAHRRPGRGRRVRIGGHPDRRPLCHCRIANFRSAR